MHPDAFAELRAHFRRDTRIACLHLDGYTGLNAGVPPKERRGLVLIDPPFERANELDLAWSALLAACSKWPTGIYALWYPVKDPHAITRFAKAVAESGLKRVLRLELGVDEIAAGGRLVRTGLIVINPPYVLEDEAASLLPALRASSPARSDRSFSRNGSWASSGAVRACNHFCCGADRNSSLTPHSGRISLMMILRSSPASPFGRKVRIALHHLALAERVEIVATDTASETDTIRKQNPLGKIPTLIAESGEAIYDSPVILEYLDHLAGGYKIIPREPKPRFAALTLQAFARWHSRRIDPARLRTPLPPRGQSGRELAHDADRQGRARVDLVGGNAAGHEH